MWAPVAWLDLGKQTLSAGNHTLQIRVNKAKDKDGKPTQFITAYDCFCLTTKPFHPDGVNKPGDTSWMTDADKAAATQTFDVPEGTDRPRAFPILTASTGTR